MHAKAEGKLFMGGTGPEEGERPLAKWSALRAARFYTLLDSPDRACIIQRFGGGIVALLDSHQLPGHCDAFETRRLSEPR